MRCDPNVKGEAEVAIPPSSCVGGEGKGDGGAAERLRCLGVDGRTGQRCGERAMMEGPLCWDCREAVLAKVSSVVGREDRAIGVGGGGGEGVTKLKRLARFTWDAGCLREIEAVRWEVQDGDAG